MNTVSYEYYLVLEQVCGGQTSPYTRYNLVLPNSANNQNNQNINKNKNINYSYNYDNNYKELLWCSDSEYYNDINLRMKKK